MELRTQLKVISDRQAAALDVNLEKAHKERQKEAVEKAKKVGSAANMLVLLSGGEG